MLLSQIAALLISISDKNQKDEILWDSSGYFVTPEELTHISCGQKVEFNSSHLENKGMYMHAIILGPFLSFFFFEFNVRQLYFLTVSP